MRQKKRTPHCSWGFTVTPLQILGLQYTTACIWSQSGGGTQRQKSRGGAEQRSGPFSRCGLLLSINQSISYKVFTVLSKLAGSQRRNFGLKSGGNTNSEGERDGLGSRGEGEENGEKVSSSSSDFGVWESVMSSPSWARGRSPGWKWFYLFILRRSLLLTAGDSEFFTFCPEKWGVPYCTPQSKKWGYRYPVNYAYAWSHSVNHTNRTKRITESWECHSVNGVCIFSFSQQCNGYR